MTLEGRSEAWTYAVCVCVCVCVSACVSACVFLFLLLSFVGCHGCHGCHVTAASLWLLPFSPTSQDTKNTNRPCHCQGAAAIEFPSFLPLAPSTPGNLVGLLNGCILSAAGVKDTVCLGKSFPIPRAERVVAKAAMADKDRRLAALRRGERDGWPLKGSSGAGGDSAAALRYPRVLGGDMYPYTQPASALFHSQVRVAVAVMWM